MQARARLIMYFRSYFFSGTFSEECLWKKNERASIFLKTLFLGCGNNVFDFKNDICHVSIKPIKITPPFL